MSFIEPNSFSFDCAMTKKNLLLREQVLKQHPQSHQFSRSFPLVLVQGASK